MKKETYEKQMAKRMVEVNKQWVKMVHLTNEFIKDNPDMHMYSLQNTVNKIADSLSLAGGWLYDNINHVYYRDKKSTTNKIRKALGYYGYEQISKQ
uniref:Uncharacterized protein n=1 Tax=viral metagenome TaxID=1070528 RepID=A0A6H1ZCF5_9ZZZZ